MEIFLVGMVFILSGLFIVAGIAIYFLPTIIAYKKHHSNRGIILLINLLLGWTLLGWIGSLVWALIDDEGKTTNKILRNIGGNKYEDLERLQKLKDNGTITEEEFQKEKAKLLN